MRIVCFCPTDLIKPRNKTYFNTSVNTRWECERLVVIVQHKYLEKFRCRLKVAGDFNVEFELWSVAVAIHWRALERLPLQRVF